MLYDYIILMKATIVQDEEYEKVIKQIEALNKKNQKLISIANNIMKTSFLRQDQEIPNVIVQFQEDMRFTFNQLIENIREFFINIDGKLKQLASIIEKRERQDEIVKDQLPSKFNQNDQKINILAARMCTIEETLRHTQQNQYKLTKIIQELVNNRSHQSEEQPTILKNSDPVYLSPIQGQIIKPKIHQNSFRLFSATDSSYSLPKSYNPVQSRYPQHNSYQQPNNFISAPQPSLSLCPPVRPSEQGLLGFPRGPSKITIKQQNCMQNTNRIHRLTYMMKGLKN